MNSCYFSFLGFSRHTKQRMRMISREQVDDNQLIYFYLFGQDPLFRELVGISILNIYLYIFLLIEALEEEPVHKIDLSCFWGNLRRDDRDNSRDCWRISDGNNFRVRSKHFCHDKTKVHRYFVYLL